ncbi:hypothetical protein KS4_09510 [Poriferisphaera corsica]|uniref:Ice-binding protein C-terminal domain-containing protein n=1 Tax=Poriferisphaera corsica TaxID=2528020 RepID=A0A517YRR2_9BACT|nr:PEP-CTERM sorting domain-containing protein [Poriferisphaera corsica]QDU32912.1 hypothetical protein KS4_09510 [Poriferisphaera corsica]
MLKQVCSVCSCAIAISIATPVQADIVEGSFAGGSFWADSPGSWFGMGNSTAISGTVQFNSDEIFDNVASNNKSVILIGDYFTQPGFNFNLNMGNLALTDSHIAFKDQQNSATLQFGVTGSTWKFEGLFAQLDFNSSGKAYRLEQSGFTWEVKERNSDGTTTLKPVLVSGFWNYGQLNITNLNKPKPIADAGGDYVWTASDFFLSLDGSGSNSPDPDPVLYVDEYQWTMGGNEYSGVNPQLGTFDVDFQSTTDSVDITLDVKDSFGVWSEASDTATISYQNADPIIDAFTAVNTDEGLALGVEFSDVDLNAMFNFMTPGFESHDVEFTYAGQLLGEDASVILDQKQLLAIFGDSDDYEITVTVTDRAGVSVSDSMLVSVVVPEPASLALMGLAGLMVMRRKRA